MRLLLGKRRFGVFVKPMAAAWAVCFGLLAIHGALAVENLLKHSPTEDEGGHILSGLLAWSVGNFKIYHVNPPLIKELASLPVGASSPVMTARTTGFFTADWWLQYQDFALANRDRLLMLTFRARGVIVAFSILGGWLVFVWSRQLFGLTGGLVSLSLWIFCPNVLCWSGVVTADMGATVLGLFAVYALRFYIRHPGGLEALWAGWALGLAILGKFTMLILYPLYFIIIFTDFWFRRKAINSSSTTIRYIHLVILAITSIFIINLGYNFQGTGHRLDSFLFKCHALTRPWGNTRINRFHGTPLGTLPVPFPAEFLAGLDEQKSHSDIAFPAYLAGQWRSRGWWYYYLYGLGVKLPLGTLALMAISGSFFLASPRFRTGMIDESLIWVPALGIFCLISSQTGINSHLRYVLPIFPFIFISCGRVGLLFLGGPTVAGMSRNVWPTLGALLVALSVAWNIGAIMRIRPHYMAYFNELAGGPENGWRHLLESNIDWGQDLLFLKRWIESHPEARPMRMAFYGGMDPRLIGLDLEAPPRGGSPTDPGPRPGWYAVSVNYVYGYEKSYNYFKFLIPVDRIGYSVLIYKISLNEANRVRSRLGLSPIPVGRGYENLDNGPRRRASPGDTSGYPVEAPP